MRTYLIFKLILPLFIVTSIVSCTKEGRKEIKENTDNLGKSIDREAQRVGEDVNKDVIESDEQIRLEKEDFKHKINAQVYKIDLQLKKIDEKQKLATTSEKIAWEERKKELEIERLKLKNNLEQLKLETKHEWRKFKLELSALLESAQKELEK